MHKYNEKTMYFGRLNVICPFTKKKKIEYILNSINKQETDIQKDFVYGLFEIEQVDCNSMSFITGLLVKYKNITDEEIVNENNKSLDKTTIPNKMIAKSEFILHLQSGLIAYHPIINKISNSKFRKEFCTLIEKANGKIFVDAEIQPINEETKLFEEIKKFEKITSLKIALHPSNPSNRERWKRTDEKLRKMEVEKYLEIYQSKKGIKIAENDEAYSNIIMAADGYGEAQIVGEKKGKKSFASTIKLQMTVNITNESLKSNINLNSLTKSFKSVLDRFEK